MWRKPYTLFFLFGIALMGLMRTSFADVEDLPDLGDESASVFSPQDERKMGEDFMRNAWRNLDIIEDPELNEYIQNLGERLVAHNGSSYKDFHFFIINDPSLNAFAVPGGYIFIHSGLFLTTQNEAELAAVMSHEIAHITQHHIPRMIAQAQRTTLPAMAALIAAIVLAGAHNGQAGEAAFALTQAGLTQNQLNFSRGYEQEADRIGIRTLAASGFDPRAMPAVFERMQAESRLNESNLPDFLRTHPVTSSRIAESRNRAESYPSHPVSDNPDFYLAQAKLKALVKDNPRDIAAAFKNQLANNDAHSDAARYGYALALTRIPDFDLARAQIAILRQHDPDKVAYAIAQADIELAAHKTDTALALFAAALKRHPQARPLAQRYAQALLENGHTRAAKDLFKTLVRHHPDDPRLYHSLATAAGDSGSYLEAHRALAEYYYLNGNFDAALEQLRIAKRFSNKSFYIEASLDARTKEIKEQAALWGRASPGNDKLLLQ